MRELIEVLGLLVKADQAVDEVQDWTLYYTMGGPVGQTAQRHRQPPRSSMADQGWVRDYRVAERHRQELQRDR